MEKKKGLIKSFFSDRVKLHKAVTFASMLFNFAWSTIKIIIGIVSKTYFFCVNGIGTLLTGVAKKTYLDNFENEDENLRNKKALVMNALLLIIGATYIVYMGRLFKFPSNTPDYGLFASIAIATVSFVELILSVGNLIKALKSKNYMLYSLRGINLACSGFSVVLTQVVLLALCKIDGSFYNAISGTIFGCFAVMIAVSALIRIPKPKR